MRIRFKNIRYLTLQITTKLSPTLCPYVLSHPSDSMPKLCLFNFNTPPSSLSQLNCVSNFPLLIDSLTFCPTVNCPLPRSFGLLSFSFTPFCFRGLDSVGGTATRYGLESPKIESQWRQGSLHPSTSSPGPTQPPEQWVTGHSWGQSERGMALITHQIYRRG